MELVKFIEARNRICETHTCYKCPLGRRLSGINVGCGDLVYKHPETAETIVEKWLKDHKEEMEP